MSKPLHKHMLACPVGFTRAVGLLNAAADADAAAVFEALVTEVFRFEENGGAIEQQRFRDELVGAGVAVTDTDMHSMVNALLYVCRGGEQHKIGPEGAPQLQEALQYHTELSPTAIACVARCWVATEEARVAAAPEGIAAVKKAFTIGQLVGVEWKVGVSVASSQCENLLAPFVSLVFRVAAVNGDVETQHIELTYAEFQDMNKTLVDVAALLETL
mmetsp:Transcript_18688/g.43519  ORF Transcript_18688/g.43519 Transcript_18688/m.43519 type:complete len:216 (-) Transcript_18688:157-804(-)|eukprot:CAMPEP_0119515364 /NCGR_PEP_ID=MMETSP1344-20130328/32879_1 /TAXON_ID=236787 /ORGANISM="Florenciella parvula, Strain CCMP2471" /LENGTH=215 /DNA_ID=CAMNT_0007552767 /DNA_START=246 /DNA_END=893 /DNA_ORIENTATION=+